ncbi:MAG TPA: M10 family metallopeptidase [Ramlibacter sp.]|uniref:M10 family metallopeptidase n=1 Tax=Ramlibacter sp. TaxID=1917967 RepID=UPI002CA5F8DC|nr:M10 family metallopeptidase [Ramlibacter sp.]HVZ42699.1 M10 family metallopeptidase [Ramlibacter sp.]
MQLNQSKQGLFSDLVTDGGIEAAGPVAAQPAPVTMVSFCSCPYCMGIAAQGGSTPTGAYATTPNASNYSYVAPVSAQGALADVVAPLMAGTKWDSVDATTARTIISYSFIDPATSSFAYGANAGFTTNCSAFSEADRQLTRELLGKIADVCNVQFVEVADNAAECGVLRYGYSPQPTAMNYAGYTFFPSTSPIGGDIWIGSNQASSQWDFYRPDLILHETLHALGLKHPFSGDSVLASQEDIIPNTVMSYSPVAGGTSGSMSAYPAEPMPYDVSALQALYGASSQNAGGDFYNLASREFQNGFHTLWDAGGRDTLYAGALTHGVALDLAGASDIGVRVAATAQGASGTIGTTYTKTLTVAAGSVIEDAIGSAYADTIQGGAADNHLTGGGGNDRLDGGAGTDTAMFNGTRDHYTVAHAADGSITVSDLSGAEGTDSLVNMERVQFADGALAYDMDGHAGEAADLATLVFGAQYVTSPGLMGVVIGLLDNGQAFPDVMQLALQCALGGHASNSDIVQLIYTHLTGHAGSAALLQPIVAQLDCGALTAGGLGVLAAEHPANEVHIDFVGLAANGLEYTPIG